jgi:hypothetical protein
MDAYYAAMSAGPTSKRGRYELQKAALLSIRQGGGFDAHWRDIGDFLMPRRTRFWSGDRNRGDKRLQNIIDSTGSFAVRTLESGMHAGLTSPARPWMKLTTPDPDLAEFGPVKEWLHVVTQRMLTVFAQTNLYNSLPLVYGDMGLFGTAAMSVLLDDQDLFRTFTYPIGSYCLAINKRGVVDTFYREYEMSVRQVVKEFGVRPGMSSIDWTTISTRVKNAWDRGLYEESVTIGWLVQPNDDRKPNAIDANKRMPFTSCHFEIDVDGQQQVASENKFLRESGFTTFPILAPRWRITGEDSYGTDSCGMMALGDVRQLQVMGRRKGQLLAKAVDPPLMGPSSLRSQKTSLIQGDITYVDAREGQMGLKPIHEVRLEGYQHLVQDANDVRFLIRRAFYEDLFLMIATSDQVLGADRPTAREIDERHEEKMLALGPVLERTNDELLDPLVDRAYELMERSGLIPEPPDELDQVKLKVEYLSILAQAQKLVGVVGQDRFVNSVLPLVEFFPEVRKKIKAFEVVNIYADITGVNPTQVRPDDEAQQMADEEQQMAAQAQQAATMKDAGQGVAAMGAAPVATGSPLDQIISGGAGSQQMAEAM